MMRTRVAQIPTPTKTANQRLFWWFPIRDATHNRVPIKPEGGNECLIPSQAVRFRQDFNS
jgi:hypothetical protein